MTIRVRKSEAEVCNKRIPLILLLQTDSRLRSTQTASTETQGEIWAVAIALTRTATSPDFQPEIGRLLSHYNNYLSPRQVDCYNFIQMREHGRAQTHARAHTHVHTHTNAHTHTHHSLIHHDRNDFHYIIKIQLEQCHITLVIGRIDVHAIPRRISNPPIPHIH